MTSKAKYFQKNTIKNTMNKKKLKKKKKRRKKELQLAKSIELLANIDFFE